MSFFKKIFQEEFPFLLASPAVIWQLFFLYLPLCLLFVYSFFEAPVLGAAKTVYSFTFAHYQQIVSATYLKVVIRSFYVASMTSLCCFFIAYPIAYFLVMKVPKRFKTILLFSLILPSWTSLIVQIYAWFSLLDKNSLLCRFLYKFGILSRTTHLMNNYFAILVVMVAVYLPFMILPLYTALEKIDKKLFEASADLGASRFQTFIRVIFPLSLPGLYAGLLLVFLPAFGEFAIPTLLGGSKTIFWGNLIVDKFLVSRNWQSGAALAIAGIIFSCLFVGALYTFINVLSSIYKKRKRRFYLKGEVFDGRK